MTAACAEDKKRTIWITWHKNNVTFDLRQMHDNAFAFMFCMSETGSSLIIWHAFVCVDQGTALANTLVVNIASWDIQYCSLDSARIQQKSAENNRPTAIRLGEEGGILVDAHIDCLLATMLKWQQTVNWRVLRLTLRCHKTPLGGLHALSTASPALNLL
jgi:hypothetical protein